MAVHRYQHTATLLTSGQVLVAGSAYGGVAGAELYDPKTGIWSSTGSMASERFQQTATLLNSGKVLVAGGFGHFGPIAQAEVYDPSTGTWSPTGSMSVPRANHTATRLRSGKVLVAGGANANGSLASAELYDPFTGTWSPTGSMAQARNAYAAVPLPNGQVLVAGGVDQNNGGTVLASAELYHPNTGRWSATGSMTEARNEFTVSPLPGAKVLAAGGSNVWGLSAPLRSAEIYDITRGLWISTGSMLAARDATTATALSTGQVLVAGGAGKQHPLPGGGSTVWLRSAELYNPATGKWVRTAAMTARRGWHTATLLLNGDVLAAGGTEGSAVQASAELFD